MMTKEIRENIKKSRWKCHKKYNIKMWKETRSLQNIN